ncbi:MAG: hypothetical protein L7S64_03610, partial [Longimicrobiales bacterium]|nr:hypothetical protein [Longimicrobiales bacterium]
LILTAAGVVVLRPRSTNKPVAVPALDRQQLLLQVARLDEDFDRSPRSDAERQAYEQRRSELLRRARSLS